jgi:Tol biopolymer transport system component
VRAEWSRDGANVIYMDHHTDTAHVVSRTWDRASGDQILASGSTIDDSSLNTVSVGPQSGFSAFRIGDSRGKTDIWIAPTDSMHARRPFITSPFSESGEAVSPDGRLLAYASNETGRDEIYIVQLPIAGSRVPVSVGGGTEPAWSRDGKQLYFRGRRHMMVAAITQRPTVSVARIYSLFVDHFIRDKWFRQYDVMADGRLLMVDEQSSTALSPRATLFFITNWQGMAGMRSDDRAGR